MARQGNGHVKLVSFRSDVQQRHSPLSILCYGVAMGRNTRTGDEAAKLEGCLARLKQELVVLDQLAATLPAIKVSEACDALEHELQQRQPPLPGS